MGIRVYDSNEMLNMEDCNTSCSCCSCSSTQNTSEQNNGTETPLTTTTTTCASKDPCGAYRDIVGNCKEIHMETNTCNLRIVGNNNRIKISMNTGNLLVIGNNNRLKIKSNHGHLKYTGNDGRISLGIESTQQNVNYIGCNGTLKIVKSMKFSKNKSTINSSSSHSKKTNCCCCNTSDGANRKTEQDDKQYNGNFKQNSSTTRTTTTSASNDKKHKKKSHSYGGANQEYWNMFNTTYDKRKNSLPNLPNSQKFDMTGNKTERVNPTKLNTNIIQTIGDIVIANASNICISPQVTNIITAKAH